MYTITATHPSGEVYQTVKYAPASMAAKRRELEKNGYEVTVVQSMRYVIYCTASYDVTRWVKCGESLTKKDARAYARSLTASGHNNVTIDPLQDPAFMDYAELLRELSSCGYSLRPMKPSIDESFPSAQYIVNGPGGRKWGFSARIELHTFLLKIRQGVPL